MIIESSFLNLYFYTVSKQKKKQNVGRGWDGFTLRRKIWVNWNQGNLFLEYFFG